MNVHPAVNPDDVAVHLTALTGAAASRRRSYNTFRIDAQRKLPYQPLGEEQINTLRTRLSRNPDQR